MAVITGRPGPDTLTGTAETDLIFGRGGADFISGREGDDAIFAGPGDDTIAGDNIPIPALGGQLGTGPYISVDFGPYPPRFGGTPGNNLIFAGSGDDSVLAGFGADTVLGGAGNDTINGYGAAGVSPSGNAAIINAEGPDFLFGGAGDDLLRGGGGGDLLDGGPDQDTLVGGVDVDTLIGGTGPDVFVFGRNLEPFTSSFALDTGVGPGNRDLILDFHEGQDQLDLAGYRNFFPGTDGQPPPVFRGTDPFEASFALQVRYQVEDGRTVVQFSAPFGTPPPGTPPTVPEAPTGEIELAGEHRLRAEDFILILA
jgi:Ca2+-binding RTX toxin-like protein